MQRLSELVRRYSNDLVPYRYVDTSSEPTRHCILGWMAREAAIPLPPPDLNTHTIGMPGIAGFAQAVQAEYGLTMDQLKELQAANDNARHAVRFAETAAALLSKWCAGPSTPPPPVDVPGSPPEVEPALLSGRNTS